MYRVIDREELKVVGKTNDLNVESIEIKGQKYLRVDSGFDRFGHYILVLKTAS